MVETPLVHTPEATEAHCKSSVSDKANEEEDFDEEDTAEEPCKEQVSHSWSEGETVAVHAAKIIENKLSKTHFKKFTG